MNRQAGRVFTVVAAVAAASSLFVACAADQGDALKASSQDTSGSGSSAGAASGSTSGSGATSGDTSGSGSAGSTTGSSGSASSGSIGSSGSSSAGSGSTSSGSSTSGGFPGSGSSGASDAGAEAAVSSATCITSSRGAQVQYATGDAMQTPTHTTQITFVLNIVNAGLTNVNLADLTLRYWFSADGAPLSDLMLSIDSAQANGGQTNIQSDVMTTFAAAPAANMTPTSDSYLQISFSSAAPTLKFGDPPVRLQLRFHGNYTTDIFNETNDYSFDATKANTQSPQTTTTVTAYDQGQLVWGCEPSAASGGSSSGSSSGASSGGDGGGGVDATAMPVADAATE